MPTPNALDAFLSELEKILTRHAIVDAYRATDSDDDLIVVCRCKMKFTADGAHGIHQARVIRGWFAMQAAQRVAPPMTRGLT